MFEYISHKAMHKTKLLEIYYQVRLTATKHFTETHCKIRKETYANTITIPVIRSREIAYVFHQHVLIIRDND